MKIYLKTLTGVVAVMLLLLTLSPGMAQPPLKFCVYPNKSPKAIITVFEPLAKFLSEATGHPVKLVTAPDQVIFQKRALEGEYDLLLACVACYFELHEKKGYSAIARGEPSFTGGMFVREDSPITKVEDLLHGKRIGAVKQHSYAGFLFWQEYLVENNLRLNPVDPYVFLGTQDSIAYGILNHKIDAGLFRTNFLESPKMKSLKNKFRLILRSPDIPHFPFVVSPNLSKEHVRQITESLTSITANTPLGEALFKSMEIQSIEAISDSDYDTFKESYNKAVQAWKKR